MTNSMHSMEMQSSIPVNTTPKSFSNCKKLSKTPLLKYQKSTPKSKENPSCFRNTRIPQPSKCKTPWTLSPRFLNKDTSEFECKLKETVSTRKKKISHIVTSRDEKESSLSRCLFFEPLSQAGNENANETKQQNETKQSMKEAEKISPIDTCPPGESDLESEATEDDDWEDEEIQANTKYTTDNTPIYQPTFRKKTFLATVLSQTKRPFLR